MRVGAGIGRCLDLAVADQLFPLDAPAPLWFVAFVLITQIRTRSHGLRPDDVIEAVETPDGVSEAIELTHILGRVGAEERIPRESFGLRVEQKCVVDMSKPFRIAVGARSLPDNLVLKVAISEDFIQLDLHVVRNVPVQVYVETPRGLEFGVHLSYPGYEVIHVVIDAARPSIFEGKTLGFFAPDRLVNSL